MTPKIEVVFWPFVRLFWSCLGSVWTLFVHIKGPLLGLFLAPKVDKTKPKFSFKYFAHFGRFEGVIFDHFEGRKGRFFGIFVFFLIFGSIT